MPARSTEGKGGVKGVVDKLRVRRPPLRTANKRTRNRGGSQMQRSTGMILTMSVEQSGGISLNTTECVTASHTRQVSTTSALFGPMGVSIGVVCESTTQNKEVIMDCLHDVGRAALDWNGENETKSSLTFDFRKSLHFLDDQQFRMLCEFNINNVQQLSNMSIRKLLEIKIRSDQLQSLLAMLQNEMCIGSNPMDLSTENIQSLKKIQEELEKLDANYDDDEQPLVIDESITIIEEDKIINESERSLDAIEENFSKIKKVKIPKTRAALKGVKTELTEIITELNGKESRLLRQLQRSKQASEAKDKNEMSIANGSEEIVTTTNETGKLAKPAKKAKGQRTVKRRRNLKNSSLKTDNNTVTNPNSTHENITSAATAGLKATFSPIKSETPITPNLTSDTPALDVNSLSSQSFDVATSPTGLSPMSILDTTASATGESPLSIIDTTASATEEIPLSILDTTASATEEIPLSILDASTSKNDSTFSRGVVFLHPQSVVIVHEDVAKSSGLLDSSIIKKRPQRRQLNLSTTKNAVLLDVSESNIIATSSEKLFATSNLPQLGALPLSQSGIEESKTLSKGYTGSNVIVQTISKHLKPYPTSPTQTNLQPKVLIKKLTTPKRAKEYNVDADSTTASIDQTGGGKANAGEVGEKSFSELTLIPQAKKTKLVKPQKDDKKHISDDADEQLEICAFKDTESAENNEFLVKENAKSTLLEQSHANESKQHEPTKSVSLESSIFGSIKSESDELEESGIILDNHSSSNKQNDMGQDSPSTSQKLIEDVKIEGAKKQLHSTPIENYKDSTRLQLASQRCIDFDTKSQKKSKGEYESYDADSIVTIANTPLSPISSGIASPINSKIILSDFRNAMEIDAYCAGIRYLLKEIDMPTIAVNKPDDFELLMRKNPADPRLCKHLRRNAHVIQIPSPLTVYNKAATQIDPRRPNSIYNTESFVHPRPQPEPAQTTPNMLLYGCLQRSPWYQSLMSTMKIQINQTISVLVRAINNFQKIRLEDPYAVFDIFKLYCAGELLEIMENLGLFVDVNGIIAEKKSISSFAGRSYGCSSVVNATYSFIQPVVEPSTITVQHQQMRSFTAPQQTFAAAAHTTFPTPQTPFISCYIDSPQLTIEKPVKFQQQHQAPEHQEQYNQRPQQYIQKRYPPMSRSGKPSRGQFSSSGPRRHCGTKVPYSYGGSRFHSSVSPAKEAPQTYGEYRARSSVSPVKENSYSCSVLRGRSSVSPVKEASHLDSVPPARSSVSPEKDAQCSDSALPARSSVSPVRQQARCSDSEGESWD